MSLATGSAKPATRSRKSIAVPMLHLTLHLSKVSPMTPNQAVSLWLTPFLALVIGAGRIAGCSDSGGDPTPQVRDAYEPGYYAHDPITSPCFTCL